MDSEVFKMYSKYYNLFYADKKYSSEVEYINEVIKRFSPKAKSILEYGSGTGGHGLLLQDMGYRIMGVERSQDMANVALSKGYQCQVSDILDFTTNEKYDVCIALFHVVSYLNSNQDLVKLFTKTRSVLNDSGLFVFDVWFTPAVMYQQPEVRIKKVEDDEVIVTRLARPDIDYISNTVTVNYEVLVKNKKNNQYVELSEAHRMRHFGVPEINLLAEQTGFKVIKAEEFLTSNQPSNQTWGVNFILQAKS
ncbi:MAG: methyltransferase domain-containing protein [Bacteroidetes bacterium]|nr:methyltransferase domain-containing protein [Bacteroidota bacterium]